LLGEFSFQGGGVFFLGGRYLKKIDEREIATNVETLLVVVVTKPIVGVEW